MHGRLRLGAAIFGAFLVAASLATPVSADVLTNSLTFSSNPAFNPTPGNDNGTTFEVLEVPLSGTRSVNVTLVDNDNNGCIASGASPVVIDVLRQASSTALTDSLDTILGRDISASATGSSVSPAQLTFTACGVAQQVLVTGGLTQNLATNILFQRNPNTTPCQSGSTCVLTARFVAVTRDPDQSLPGVVASSTNWSLGSSLATMAPDINFTMGTRPLVPLTGDWNGDGTETPGFFSNGVFYLQDQVPPDGAFDLQFTFGDPRGFPVAGDFNGDAFDDVAVMRNGFWQIHHINPISTPPPDTTATFGPALAWPTIVPVAGDWNGDGIDGIGYYALSGGGNPGDWFLSQTAYSPAPALALSFNFGGAGLYPVVGDWDGNLTDGVGTKVMAGTTWSLRNTLSAGPAERTFDFGTANTLPLTWKLWPILA